MKNQVLKNLSVVAPEEKKDRKVSKPRIKVEKTWKDKLFTVKNGRGVGGAVFGSSASCIAYLTMHESLLPTLHSFKSNPMTAESGLYTAAYSVILLGCLLFSFPTAYEFFMRAFRDRGKAFGLVVLFELTMLASNLAWLSLACVGLLGVINGVSAAINSMSKFEQEKNPF